MTELIRGNEEQLSVCTCKAITWEISPLPGFSTTTEPIHSDDEDGALSVLTCKAVKREISPFPWVFDDDRADS